MLRERASKCRRHPGFMSKRKGGSSQADQPSINRARIVTRPRQVPCLNHPANLRALWLIFIHFQSLLVQVIQAWHIKPQQGLATAVLISFQQVNWQDHFQPDRGLIVLA
jgi:hypothetical protein